MAKNNRTYFQKGLTLFFLMLVPIFIAMNFSIIRSKKTFHLDYSSDFVPVDEVFSEKSFVFIVPLIENKKACEHNFASILGQKYDNYRIVLIETPKTTPIAKELLLVASKHAKRHLITRIKSEREKPPLQTFKEAVESLRDDEIVVQINPNDWLAHENALQKLNRIYTSSGEVWLAYSQYLEYPSYRKGKLKPYLKRMLRNRDPRKIPWLSSHFKTYYAGLFKQIRKDDSFMQSQVLEEESLDLYLLPMVELSKNHIRYVDDILYIHNIAPLSPIF